MSNYLARAKAMLLSKDPAVVAAVKAANDSLLRCKLLTPGQVHNDATMANLSVQYANESFIGAKLMPVVTCSKMSDIFYKMGKRDRRAVPSSEVGARSNPNEVNENRTTDTYSCQPYALKGFLDDLTMRNQDAPLNEMLDLVASVNDAIDLGVEQRIATVMTTAANFANTSTLSGTDQWNSSTGGDPIEDIQTAIDACEMGPGATRLVAYCGIEVARVLQRHPTFLDLFKYTNQGLVPMNQIAAWFGLDEILVGKAREDTANEGQTASYGRIWGKHFGVTRVAVNPSPRTAAFGFTFRFGQKETTQWYDPNPGMSGGYYAKVGHADDYKVVANDTAYLYRDAVA